MDEYNNPFSSEYVSKGTEDRDTDDETSSESILEEPVKIIPESRKYGISKPIRIIIRGTITK